MRKIVVGLLALAVLTPATAGICEPSEYAQYKDRLRRKDGRESLARLYCLNKAIGDIRTNPREAALCRAELSKILDALSSANGDAYITWAGGGCKGDAPKNR